MTNADYIWKNPGNKFKRKIEFEMVRSGEQYLRISDWVLCNWFHNLDPSADYLLPNVISIGPLLANNLPCGNFWSEDLTCLSWLDSQPPESVIYAALAA